MKEFVQRIVSLICLLYPYRLHRLIIKKKNFIYSCWIQQEFREVGQKTRFIMPLYTRGGKNIIIGKNCLFYRACEINAWDNYKGFDYSPTIEIGDNCQFGPYTHITCCNKIIIGNGVLTGSNVIISDNNHGSLTKEDINLEPRMRMLTTKGPVVIEDNVWIGDKVAILSGVHIGANSIIASNSVVTHDVPAFSIVGGTPARIIKEIQ